MVINMEDSNEAIVIGEMAVTQPGSQAMACCPRDYTRNLGEPMFSLQTDGHKGCMETGFTGALENKTQPNGAGSGVSIGAKNKPLHTPMSRKWKRVLEAEEKRLEEGA